MQSNKNLIIGAVVVIVVIVAAAFGAVKYADTKNAQTAAVPTTTVPQPSTPVATSPEASTTDTSSGSSTYKDGTYTAVGDYHSPGGAQTLNVTLTLKDDVITDATVTSGAIDPTSTHYQGIFIANYKQYVIGKDISTVSLSKVSGSSLTSGGFNDALAKIEAQAQA